MAIRVFNKQWLRWSQYAYFFMGLSFLFWMFFFDAEDLITQYKLWRRCKSLEVEKVYYQTKIVHIQQDLQKLAGNEALLEKFAREKYFMRKKTEDLYVVVDP